MQGIMTVDRWGHRYGPLAGRVLLALVFLLSGIQKLSSFEPTRSYMQSAGMPAATLFLILAISLEVFGGVALVLGLGTRVVALALVLFLLPVTLTFHGFWRHAGFEQQQQLVEFLKNLAIIGGLLSVGAQGAGELSLDGYFARHGWPWQRAKRHGAEPSIGRIG